MCVVVPYLISGTLEDGKLNGEERPISESKDVEQIVVIENFKESLSPMEQSETTDSAHVSLKDGLVDASKLKGEELRVDTCI